MSLARVFFATAVLVALSACATTNKFQLPVPAGGSSFYVVNNGANTVTTYLTNLSGDVTPVSTVTGFSNPVSIADDNNGNLWVLQTGAGAPSLVRFPKNASGPLSVATTATISGSNTTLQSAMPKAVTVDNTGNVWVSTSSPLPLPVTSPVPIVASGTLLKFAAGASGNVSPAALVGGSNTRLQNPVGLTVDANNDIVAVDSVTSSLVFFANGAAGNVAPLTQITGPKTTIANPVAISRGASPSDIVTVNPNGTILVFGAGSYSLAVPSNDIAPLAAIAGTNTGLNTPTGVAYVCCINQGIFVTNAPAQTGAAPPPSVAEFSQTGATYPSGNVAPGQTWFGAGSGLLAPVAVIQ